MARIYFITGSDTAVGKTVLTTLLARHLCRRQSIVAALKPIASGTRDDPNALYEALGRTLPLREINPWWFRAPLSPLIAARRAQRKVTFDDVLSHVTRFTQFSDFVLVEGAGGLLSPLGEDFDSLDLILALKATPLVVVPNRLGAVNQALLTLAALPQTPARNARLILMNPQRRDDASRTNPGLIAEIMPRLRLYELPWLDPAHMNGSKPLSGSVRRVLNELVKPDEKTNVKKPNAESGVLRLFD